MSSQLSTDLSSVPRVRSGKGILAFSDDLQPATVLGHTIAGTSVDDSTHRAMTARSGGCERASSAPHQPDKSAKPGIERNKRRSQMIARRRRCAEGSGTSPTKSPDGAFRHALPLPGVHIQRRRWRYASHSRWITQQTKAGFRLEVCDEPTQSAMEFYGFRPSESTREVMKKEDDTGACVWTWHEQAAVFTATVPGGYAGAHNYAVAPGDTDLLLLAEA